MKKRLACLIAMMALFCSVAHAEEISDWISEEDVAMLHSAGFIVEYNEADYLFSILPSDPLLYIEDDIMIAPMIYGVDNATLLYLRVGDMTKEDEVLTQIDVYTIMSTHFRHDVLLDERQEGAYDFALGLIGTFMAGEIVGYDDGGVVQLQYPSGVSSLQMTDTQIEGLRTLLLAYEKIPGFRKPLEQADRMCPIIIE